MECVARMEIDRQAPRSTLREVGPWQHRVLRVFQVTALVFVIDTLVQAVLAGLFVTGDVGLLGLHNANAQLLSAVLIVETVAAVAVWRTKQSSMLPPCICAVLIIAVAGQQVAGHARLLIVHIPLGVSIFGGAMVLLTWAVLIPTGSRQ